MWKFFKTYFATAALMTFSLLLGKIWGANTKSLDDLPKPSPAKKFDLEKLKKEIAEKKAVKKDYFAQQQWDWLPVVVQPKYGKFVPPKMSKVVTGNFMPDMYGNVTIDSHLYNDMKSQVLKVLEASSDPDVVAVRKAIKGNEITLGFAQDVEGLVQFSYWPKEYVIPREADPSQNAYFPYFRVSMYFLQNDVTADDVLSLYTALAREYSRYLLVKENDGNDFWKLYVNTAGFMSLFVPFSKEQCVLYWENDLRSWKFGAELGVRMGYRQDLTIRVENELVLKQFLFILRKDYVAMRHPECIQPWAEAAGHPHPDAFLEDFIRMQFGQIATTFQSPVNGGAQLSPVP